MNHVIRILAALAMAAQTLIVVADVLPAEWSSYNKGYAGQRYSPLKQINRSNVASLRPVCEVELGEPGSFQSGLVVIGRTLYLTTPHTTLALDAVDCSLKWRHVVKQTDREIHPSNRGPAYAEGRLFRGTPDGRLIALDAMTGNLLWSVNLRDGHPGEFVSAAPIVWGEKLFVGTSGGDWGSFSRMLAFDTRTGSELWHFNLTPRDGEPGAETWGNVPEAQRRGASSWSSYALDPETGEVFLTTGNPVPALDASVRKGDNLYTNSLVALDARSGKLNWYYQVLPNDDHDWDLASAPMLYQAGRSMVAVSSKDGHLYGIDRSARSLSFKTPVTTVLNQDIRPTVEGIRACPGLYGGTLWNGPAYDPAGKTIFVGTADRCQIFKRYAPGEENSPMARGFGTVAVVSNQPEDISQGWLYAVDAVTGRPRWKFRNEAPILSAVTPTAGGIVFAGDVNGKFFALDSATGKRLYQLETGAMLGGGIVSYQAGQRQYVAFANGGLTRAIYPTRAGTPKVIIATLGKPGIKPKRVKIDPIDSSADAGSGIPKLYSQLCALCHGDQGQGIDGPRLRGVVQRNDTRPVAEILRAPRNGMPSYVPGLLDEKDAAEMARFIENWK